MLSLQTKKYQNLEGHNSWSKTSKSNLSMDLKGMDYVLSTNEISNLHMLDFLKYKPQEIQRFC